MDDKTDVNKEDIRETTRKLADIFKDRWNKEIQHIDSHIENKTNSILLKYLGIRWQSFGVIILIVLGFMATHSVVIYFVNDGTIKSSIEKSMEGHQKDMKEIKRSLASTSEALVEDRKMIKELKVGVGNIEKFLIKNTRGGKVERTVDSKFEPILVQPKQ